ncbi:MAG: serpin family protein [Mogibacterium sp.]|nr:serpin family protein [Mogibacterium sp.]
MRFITVRMKVITAVIVMVTVCMAAVYCGSMQTYAASHGKKALSADRISIRSGAACALRVKNADRKVRWSTSNKNIVRITKRSGKYKQTVRLTAGGRAGNCTVRAKIGKLSLKCRVMVIKDHHDDPVPVPDPDYSEGFPERMTDFSVRLLQSTVQYDSSNGKKANVLISPDSVITALGMLENGAEGETLAQLEGLTGGYGIDYLNSDLCAFHTRLAGHKDPLYTAANSIWTNRDQISIGKEYSDKCLQFYNAEAYEREFNEAAKNEMNKWIEDNTRGMIKNIISRLEPSARIILINALAFEGKWEEQFDDSQVIKEAFTAEDGSKADVNMLSGFLSGRGSYIELNGGKGLVKDYENGRISFVGILPPEGMSLDDYIGGLKGADFVAAWNSRRDPELRIKIPEFKYDYDASLKDILKSMGVTKAFTDAAEFGKMTGTPASLVKVDDVLHKTHIELDRNGTKAAAATAVVMKANSAYAPDREKKEVYLNRPFVYALVDKSTGIPIFIGAVRTMDK